MARVKLAKYAGFCMGVRRAMNRTLEAALKKGGPIYTYGPLIHNPQVLEILKSKGVEVLNGTEEGRPLPERGTVIIRAHGVSPEEMEKIKGCGLYLLNATCPHVGKVQGIIQRHARQGYATVIIGERDHAEVIGLLGYTQGRGFVINTVEEVASLPPLEKVCLVAQTTQDRDRFQEFADAVRRRFPETKVFNTICDSTHRRQGETSELARKVEAMVVVGGKGSGNTRRLAGISERAGIPTYHVETEKELDPKELARFETIGVTAGASTPHWLILRVVERLNSLHRRKGGLQFFSRLSRLAVISYLYLAAGAGCLTYASALLQGLEPKISWILIAACYVFSMHVLNRLTDKASERYNQPGRMELYERYGTWLILAGIASAGTALTLSWFLGAFPFLLLLAISGLGMIYNLPIFPGRLAKVIRHRRLKDLAGSKALFVALAWGIVTSLLPALSGGGSINLGTAVAFAFSAVLVFARSTLYDFKDIQGDLMVGKETIPIVLGRRKTEVLTVILLVALGGVLTLARPLGWIPPVASFLLLSLAYVVLYYFLYLKRLLGQGFLFEGMVDGNFIFTGFLAFLWKAF